MHSVAEGSGRPWADIRCPDLVALKLRSNPAYTQLNAAPPGRHTSEAICASKRRLTGIIISDDGRGR